MTLWQIGEFDQSSEEFGVHLPPSAPSQAGARDPVYRVGESDWKKDWPAFHPGSANGKAGGREHRYTVNFPMAKPARGVYTLTVSTLPYMPRRPNLRIEINGKKGFFYLRPHVSYDLGDGVVAFLPQYSWQEL